MAERQNGDIWIGTLGSGASVYDPTANEFTQHNHDSNNPQSIGEQNIKAIFVDPNDQVWLGTDNSGLNRWDERTNTFEHYKHSTKDSTSISSNEIRAIAADNLGNIWIGCLEHAQDQHAFLHC